MSFASRRITNGTSHIEPVQPVQHRKTRDCLKLLLLSQFQARNRCRFCAKSSRRWAIRSPASSSRSCTTSATPWPPSRRAATQWWSAGARERARRARRPRRGCSRCSPPCSSRRSRGTAGRRKRNRYIMCSECGSRSVPRFWQFRGLARKKIYKRKFLKKFTEPCGLT